jgi:LysR family transcriptional regulator, nitrogen assimilation regulatory protein
MQARLIEYFLRTTELGSINKTAADLRMSQPSLSRWLSLLEQEVGASLLVRSRQGVRATDAGQLLVDRARPILRELHALRDDVGKRASHRFNLAMPFSLQRFVTAPFAEFILRNAKETNLRVYEGINNSIRTWMETGIVDAAVMVSTERAPENFSASPLLQEQLLLVGDRNAGLRLDTWVPLSRLGIAHLILPGRPNVISALVENAMRRAGHPYRNRFEAETLSLCLELTRRGLGYTVMPYSALHHVLRDQGELTAAPVKTLIVTWRLHVNRARTYAVSTQTVVRTLSDHIAKTIASGEWMFARNLQKKPKTFYPSDPK